MIAYLDASILTSVLLKDSGWQDVNAWLAASPRSVTISDFGVGEFVSAVSLRYRSGAASWDDAHAMIAQVDAISSTWGRALVSSDDIARATAHVANFELHLRLRDAIHVAVAQRLGAILVTGDRQQARASRLLAHPTLNPISGEDRQ